jgi:hypothetical protein
MKQRDWSIIEFEERSLMATQAQPRLHTFRSSRLRKAPVANGEEDFLAGIMVSVSASLESMNEDEREKAVTAAENAVAHLQ